jgi:hypothetical protein
MWDQRMLRSQCPRGLLQRDEKQLGAMNLHPRFEI